MRENLQGFAIVRSLACWLRPAGADTLAGLDLVIVTDTKVLNFRMSEKGIVPIDLVISKNMELTRCLASALA